MATLSRWEYIIVPATGNETLGAEMTDDAPKKAKIERKNLNGLTVVLTNGNVRRETTRVLYTRRHSASPTTPFRKALQAATDVAEGAVDALNERIDAAEAKVQDAEGDVHRLEREVDAARTRAADARAQRDRLGRELEREVNTRAEQLKA